MKITRVLALFAVALFLLAPAAQAQQGPFLPSYFSVMGGAYVPEGTDLDDNNADTGFAGLLVFGYQATPFIGFQTDLGYLETSGDANFKVSAFPIAVSLKLGVPIAFFEPYVLGGGGVYFAQREIGNVDDNSTEFAGHAAAGINFNFGRFQFGAEARYLWLEVDNLDVDGVLVMGKLGARF